MISNSYLLWATWQSTGSSTGIGEICYVANVSSITVYHNHNLNYQNISNYINISKSFKIKVFTFAAPVGIGTNFVAKAFDDLLQQEGEIHTDSRRLMKTACTKFLLNCELVILVWQSLEQYGVLNRGVLRQMQGLVPWLSHFPLSARWQAISTFPTFGTSFLSGPFRQKLYVFVDTAAVKRKTLSV